MLKMIVGVCVIVCALCVSARAQVIIGDDQMTAWRQLRGFGLHLDSVMENGHVRMYHADSIRLAGILNNVEVYLNDSSRVSRMRFVARDVDTALFADKYAYVLTSPKIATREDDGRVLRLTLPQDGYIVTMSYDRKLGEIREEDYAVVPGH